MGFSRIKAIEYYLPKNTEQNDANNRTVKKVGIFQKHIAAEDEFASDLAVQAAEQLFEKHSIERESIEYVLYCTQSPDYFLPTTACLIQERLGLNNSVGALDFNLGCSGFVYGLSMAKGLIESGQVKNVLLLTGETYSKFVNPKDRSVQLLFGDAGSATLIEASDVAGLHHFAFGTDGSGAKNLIVPYGGMRNREHAVELIEEEDAYGNVRHQGNLYMKGSAVFNFTSREIPKSIDQFFEKHSLQFTDFDKIIFHQANLYMLNSLRDKMSIPEDKFVTDFEDCGNTVSATIPIALKRQIDNGEIQRGDHILLVGFGVGYSWAIGSMHY
ncbi:ketoacyl-ACP synthase III [Sporosarcina sp. PTS2304]|uniref:3-oxoacyl-ACP synthase III family protein n=1 Tax=Sporosarcina sp. PTS2304 TaxID=2283194 RepID=UPI000E0D6ACD|nr:ketoacyl-ACP synthase III [Sporosarcina sp. PTS2304]AXI01209.1 ketoacyl-ACP synthase III [Sporosarcina sp. PTS2304]